MSDLRRSLDFIEAAAAAQTLEELQTRLTAVLAEFGAHHYAMMALAGRGEEGPRTPMPLSRATPLEWAERYRERGYYNFDPVVHMTIGRPAPFTWDDLDVRNFSGGAKTVFCEGRDILKADSSLVIPTHDAHGIAGFVSLFFPDHGPDESMRRALKLIAVYALERAKELSGVEARAPTGERCPLTARQREVLAFLAMGKTDWEIGAILGISEKTANHHIEEAKRRIGVVTRSQAAAVAVHRGWVAL